MSNLVPDCVTSGLVKETSISKQLYINGQNKYYFAYKIPLSCLYYNDKNDRIASFMNQYKDEHDGNIPSRDNIEEYNNIMGDFIRRSNPSKLDDTKKDIEIKTQQEVGVVFNDGRIIDGNRRFTCLRELAKEHEGDPQYKYFNAFVLEDEVSDKDIKILELTLQHSDRPVPYELEEKLIGIYQDVVKNKLLTPEEYINCLSPGEANDFPAKLEQSKIMARFLEFIGMPEKYHIVKKLKIASGFAPLENYERTKLKKNPELKEQLEELVFSFFVLSMPDAVHQIRKIFKFNTNLMTQFLKAQKDLVEEIKSHLPNISEEDRKGLAETAFNVLDQWDVSFDMSQTKGKPQKVLEEAIRKINTISMEVVKTYSEDELLTFTNTLKELEELINIKKQELNK